MTFLYLLVLLACLVVALPLEVWLRTGVLARWRRLVRTLLPVLAVFLVWDVLAIRAGHWRYDAETTTGVRIGNLPVEEVLFFLVIPLCSILTLEAVRAVRGWPVGDE